MPAQSGHVGSIDDCRLELADHVPGGRCAGGFTSLELGTDIAGSSRLPSHFCRVFGPIAHSAADLDLLLGVLAGPDPDAAPAWRVELPAPRREHLSDYRIGMWLDDPAYPVGSQYAAVLADAVGQLRRREARARMHQQEGAPTSLVVVASVIVTSVSPGARSCRLDRGELRR